MKKATILVTLCLTCVCMVNAQIGRSLDWPTFGGDLARTGWEKADVNFKKDAIAKDFQLLWKLKPSTPAKGQHALMPPIVIGTLVGYRGFKELAFIAGTDDALYVMDADLKRMYWQKRIEVKKPKAEPAKCAASMTAVPTLMTISFRPRPRPAPGSTAPVAPRRPTPNPMFGPRSVYAISSDGKLRRINVANGADSNPPVQVLPPGARASTLNMNDMVIYTASQGCGDAENRVWAIDIGDPDAAPTVKSFLSGGAGFIGMGGPAIGSDGIVYAQTGDGPSDPNANKFSNAVIALTPRDLTLKDYFLAPSPASSTKTKPGMNETSPVIFAWKGHDVIASAGRDGRIYLLDSQTLGGADHKTPLAQTAPLAAGDGGVFGSLSSWEDGQGTRWILAPVWGGLSPDLKVSMASGDTKKGAIVAFKLEEKDGKPALTPAWASRDLMRPTPPVIANGVVFALSSGDAARKMHAVLYALDGATGKEIWSTGDQVTAPGSLTGLTMANGRVYFATSDYTIWVFGVPLEI